jgi:hypothetical protein
MPQRVWLYLRHLTSEWKNFLIALGLFILLILAVISLAQLFIAVIPPDCHQQWHHVTVPITVNGVQGTEDKWVCQ